MIKYRPRKFLDACAPQRVDNNIRMKQSALGPTPEMMSEGMQSEQKHVPSMVYLCP